VNRLNRFRDESGFTFIELVAVVLVIGVLIAIAVPVYLSLTGSARMAGGKANVRSAIPTAEDMAGTRGNYAGITGATLRTMTPGIGPNVIAVAVNSNNGYCIQDTEGGGAPSYNFVGGVPGAALQAGYSAGVIQLGTCLQVVGTAAN